MQLGFLFCCCNNTLFSLFTNKVYPNNYSLWTVCTDANKSNLSLLFTKFLSWELDHSCPSPAGHEEGLSWKPSWASFFLGSLSSPSSVASSFSLLRRTFVVSSSLRSSSSTSPSLIVLPLLLENSCVFIARRSEIRKPSRVRNDVVQTGAAALIAAPRDSSIPK